MVFISNTTKMCIRDRLSTILIGNNIVNITCTSLVTILCVKGFGEDVGATLSTVITTVVILVFGEVSPKSIAKESAETVAMLSAPLLRKMCIRDRGCSAF